jgi:hypothetical protein
MVKEVAMLVELDDILEVLEKWKEAMQEVVEGVMEVFMLGAKVVGG